MKTTTTNILVPPNCFSLELSDEARIPNRPRLDKMSGLPFSSLNRPTSAHDYRRDKRPFSSHPLAAQWHDVENRVRSALQPYRCLSLANPRTSTTRSRSDGGQKRARRQTAGHAIVVFLETLPRSSDPSLSFGMQLGVETMPKAPNRPPSAPGFRFSHWPLRVAS